MKDIQTEKDVLEKVDKINLALEEMSKVIVGQREILRSIMICMLAGGHCLLEGVPGLAKTLMISTLARVSSMDFKRVQFTPDLMPSDILGTEVLEEDHSSGKRFFKFQQGPVFTRLLLADEINRTPPKTQAALLEAMQEKSVSYAGVLHKLPDPFFVLATQNPLEQSGTYPLPEAQLDRFLMYVKVGYPNAEEEAEILQRTTSDKTESINEKMTAKDLIELQHLTRQVSVSNSLIDAASQLVRSTRPDGSSSDRVRQYFQWGAGPRAGQAIILCAKANALMKGRFAVIPEDIQQVALPVLRHRILLNFKAETENLSIDRLLKDLLDAQLSSLS